MVVVVYCLFVLAVCCLMLVAFCLLLFVFVVLLGVVNAINEYCSLYVYVSFVACWP